jgi:hypothetical protein
MENTDPLFDDAGKIISKALSSLTPEFRSNIKAGKRMRALFLDHSVEGMDSYCTDCITKDLLKTT